jgi:hypothetical protein
MPSIVFGCTIKARAFEDERYLEYFWLATKDRELSFASCMVFKLSTIALPSPINEVSKSFDSSNSE